MFKVKQSSLFHVNNMRGSKFKFTYLSFANVPAMFWGHDGPNLVAFTAAELVNSLGAAKRRGPTGGCANGMPKYSETSGFHDEACPLPLPLTVSPTWPT